MELGSNFKNYPVASKLWEESSCSWKPFTEQNVSNFVIRSLEKGEEQEVASVWAQGFPELFRGTFGFVLVPSAYGIFFSDEWRMFVFQEQSGVIAGAWLLRMDALNLSADFSLVVVHPDFRNRGLLRATAAMFDRYVDECGVELATISVARFHTATLKVFRDLGFQSVGVIPGAIRANVHGARYRRDSIELHYKLYRDAATLVPPVENYEV